MLSWRRWAALACASRYEVRICFQLVDGTGANAGSRRAWNIASRSAVVVDRKIENREGRAMNIGIPISGDDEQAKRTVAELIDQIGFDAVDAGTLAEGGRKHQPGTPAYTDGLHTGELRVRLSA
jgi:hypothetical protein